MTKTIGVVTVGRSDYSSYLPVLGRITADAELSLRLIVGGTHLSPEFGLTVRAIEADGWPIAARVETVVPSDTPQAIAESMALAVAGFARAYAEVQPDVVLVLGDRFDMHAAALAALPCAIPVAHLHGGEITEGAIDDALRHSITKLSHLHFVSTEEAARRLRQMGEEAWRVTVSGAPSLDTLSTMTFLDREALGRQIGMALAAPPLLVTYHPVTLEHEQAAWQTGELLAALQSFEGPIIFTMPGLDTGARAVAALIRAFVETTPRARLIPSLGAQSYFSLMACAGAMVGNSSSGIIEAPSVALPVVNIGARQQGRLRAANVIDVGYERAAIQEGIRRALAPGNALRLQGLANPYGNGRASEIIVERLREVPLGERLIRKRFASLREAAVESGQPEAAHAG